MRIFIVIGHKATTSPNFSLEDIPGTSGRLDILCRCINAAFVLSHGIRKDVNIFLILCGGAEPKTISLKGSEIKHLNPDERTTAALLKKALEIPATNVWSKSTPGIYVRKSGLIELLKEIKDIRITYMREDGADIRSAYLQTDAGIFLLGDHLGFTQEEDCEIRHFNYEIISVSPMSLHADHCIILINNELDRLEREIQHHERK